MTGWHVAFACTTQVVLLHLPGRGAQAAQPQACDNRLTAYIEVHAAPQRAAAAVPAQQCTHPEPHRPACSPTLAPTESPALRHCCTRASNVQCCSWCASPTPTRETADDPERCSRHRSTNGPKHQWPSTQVLLNHSALHTAALLHRRNSPHNTKTPLPAFGTSSKPISRIALGQQPEHTPADTLHKTAHIMSQPLLPSCF